MIEQTIYVAADETVFEDKDECLMYENFLKNKDRVVRLTSEGEIAYTSSDTYYVYLATLEIAHAFLKNERDDGYSFEGITGPGFYLWNEDKLSYMSIDCFVNTLIEKTLNMKDKMKSLYEKRCLSEDTDDEIY